MFFLLKRKLVGTLLAFLGVVCLLLADAAYGGYILKLQNQEWAAPVYHWLAEHAGYSFAEAGFAALYLSVLLSITALLLSVWGIRRGGFWYGLGSLPDIALAGAVLLFAGPTWLLTTSGLLLLLVSPHTQSFWDRLFSLLCLLFPLLSFLLVKFIIRRPAPAPSPRPPRTDIDTPNDL